MRKVMCRLGYALFMLGLIAFCFGAVMILGFLSRILQWSLYFSGFGAMPMGWQEYCLFGGAAVLIVGILVMIISLFIPKKKETTQAPAEEAPETGDISNMGMPVVLLVAAMIAMFGVALYDMKKRRA